MKKIGSFMKKTNPEMKCAECKRLGKELARAAIPLLTFKGRIVCQDCINKLRREEREKQEREKQEREKQEREKQEREKHKNVKNKSKKKSKIYTTIKM